MVSRPNMTGVVFSDHASGRRPTLAQRDILDHARGVPPQELVCVACVTHRRPHDVPWTQHAIGCRLRTPDRVANLHASLHTEPSQRADG